MGELCAVASGQAGRDGVGLADRVLARDALGFPGIGLAVLTLLLLGQASSGGAVTPLFVPDFFGTVAPWLPTGAGVSLRRNVVYFDGAAIAGPLMVLAGWGLFGLTLELAAQARTRLSLARRSEPVPVPA